MQQTVVTLWHDQAVKRTKDKEDQENMKKVADFVQNSEKKHKKYTQSKIKFVSGKEGLK